MAKALNAAGANTEATDQDGGTALTRASSNGHAEVTEALLAAGAGKEATIKGGCTALIPQHWLLCVCVCISSILISS